MLIGGVLLAAGMELHLRPGDYDGDQEIHFVIERVTARGADWVAVSGRQMATATAPWKNCRLRIQVDALKRSLALKRT